MRERIENEHICIHSYSDRMKKEELSCSNNSKSIRIETDRRMKREKEKSDRRALIHR